MELFKFEYFVKKCSKFEGNPSKTRKIVQTLENSENGTFPKVCWVFRDKMELSIKWNFWSNFASFKTQNGTPFSRRSRIAFSEIVTALLKIVYVKGIYQTFVTLFEVIVSALCTPETYMFEMFLPVSISRSFRFYFSLRCAPLLTPLKSGYHRRINIQISNLFMGWTMGKSHQEGIWECW